MTTNCSGSHCSPWASMVRLALELFNQRGEFSPIAHTDEREGESFCSNIYAFHRSLFSPFRRMSNPQNESSGK